MEPSAKGKMIDEARAHLYGFQCAGCLGKGIIVHGQQARVRVQHSARGCPIQADVQTRHPLLYARDMGYGYGHSNPVEFNG
jgi:hypothetical protein